MRAQLTLQQPRNSLRKRLLCSSALGLTALFLAGVSPQSVVADTLYYDNGPLPGVIDTINGDWGNNEGGWNTASDGTGTDTTFKNNPGDDVNFTGTGVRVNLTTDVEPVSITFGVDGYVILADPGAPDSEIEVKGGGSAGLAIDVTNADDVAQISANISTQGNSNRPITVNETGDGTLRLTGDNSVAVSLLDVKGGQLINLGNYGGPVEINGGKMLAVDGDIADDVTVNTGQLVLKGGTFSGGDIIINDGEVFVRHGSDPATAAALAVDVDVDGASGSLRVIAGNTLTGTITQTNGSVNVLGTYVGTAGVSGGTFTTTGTIDGGVDVSGVGSLVVNAGNVDGTVTNSGLGQITLNGGSVTMVENDEGTTTVAGAATADITNGTGGTIGKLDILGTGVLTGTITNLNGTTTNDGEVVGAVDVDGGTFQNNATVTGTVSASGGGIVNANSGSDVTGLLTNDGGDVNALGGDFSGGIRNVSGTLDILANTSAVVENAGGTTTVNNGFALSGAFTNSDGFTNNFGTLNDAVSISGGTLVNEMSGVIDDSVTLSGMGTLDAQMGSQVAGLVTLNGGTVEHNGGTFTTGISNSAGTVNLNVITDTVVTNEGGQVNIAGGISLNQNYTSNKGSTDNDGDINGNVIISGMSGDGIADQFDNDGNILGTVNVSGTGILNANSGNIQGQLTLTGGTVNANGGTFTLDLDNNGGALNIASNTAANVLSRGGTTTINGGQMLTGDVLATGGDFNNQGTLAGKLTINGGDATNTGTINLDTRLNSGTFDANGGTIIGQTVVVGGQLNAGGTDFAGGLRGQGGTIIVDGDTMVDLVNIGSDVTVESGHSLIGILTNQGGTVTNNGTLDGVVKVNGGEVASSGILTDNVTVNAGGTFRTTGGTIQGDVVNNGGDIFANGGTYQGLLRTNSGETRVGGSITIDTVTNAGGTITIENAGIVDGDVTNVSGTTTQSGEVTGDVTVLGGTYNARGVVGMDLNNNGGAVVANGAQVAGDVRNLSGSFTVAGASTGALTNNDALTVNAAGTWTGSIDHNSGIATNNGTVDGVVKLRGGTWTQNAGADTQQTTNILAGGSLVAAGGDFSGGIVAIDGALSITGDTMADIQNKGINFNIGVARTVTGDLTNQAGIVNLSGDLIGALTVKGGQVRTGANALVTGDTKVSQSGLLTMNGGEFTQEVRLFGGNIQVNGATVADVRVSGGAMNINAAGTLDGDLIQTGGTVTNNGELGQTARVIGGTLVNNGTISDRLTIANAGTVDHNSGNAAGGITLTGGELNLNGGQVVGTLNNNGGVVNLNADTVVNVAVRDGDFFVNSGQTVEGFVRNFDDGYVRVDGTIDGNLINSGLVDYFGNLTGTLSNTGTINVDPNNARAKSAAAASTKAFTLSGPTSSIGEIQNNSTGSLTLDSVNFLTNLVENRGSITISDGFALASRGDAIFYGSGSLTINDGTLAGNIDFRGGGDVDLTDATLEGDVTAATLISSSGNTQVISGNFPPSTGPIGSGSLAFTDNGRLTVNDGVFSVEGDLSTNANTRLTVAAGATLEADTITSNGILNMAAGSTLRAGTLGTNTGTANLSNGVVVEGDFINSGTIASFGRLRFADGLRGAGRVTVAGNASTADRINVDGALGAQTFDLDIDLSGSTGSADRIVMSSGAFVTGDIVLNFNVLGAGGEQDQDVVVLDAAAGQGAINAVANGLPDASDFALTDGIIVYGLTQNDAGDLIVFDALDQGISSIAGTIVLAQSLIGSVINRPSSPFVSGLAFQDEDPCGAGIWARAIGGQADATGEITQLEGSTTPFDSSISADYYGVQLGGDYACFNGFYDGWDLAFGAIGGVNIGQSNQPIFAPDPAQEGGLSDIQTSVTDVDFTQAYGGVYVAAVRDRLAVDLQYRLEKTDYTATNVEASGGATLGLTDENFSSEGQTLSGAVSYSMDVKNTDLTFVPTVGFAYSKVSTDPINFEGRGVVQIDDFDSKIGFVGGTLTRTRVGGDGVSALTQFGTVTVYNDFAENPTSTFTRSDNGDETRISSENLGTYGEISAGVNYVRILQPGEFGAVKQFNASVRGDVRVSDRLESWGITAQARFQF